MSEAATETTSRIVWFGVPATDTQRAQDFYGRLLGWQFERFGDEDYYVSQEAGGAIHAAPDRNGVLTYFGVADVDAAADRVRELGGEADEADEMPGVGRYAECRDTEGNLFGLYQDGGAA